MRAFIVRPFGPRKTGGTQPIEIDFDRVERELIDPALRHHNIEGRTTVDITAQHNIRIDMFQHLVTADLVVADISMHNANVFYELGIRHALRDRHTFLLRCKGDDVPFDLRTDRYLEYDPKNPAGALQDLIDALAATVQSKQKDSPVFQLLPALEPEDQARFIIVPRDFSEDVARAAAEGLAGDLELLGEEAAGFPWESVALRLVGRAQFRMKSWEGARATWEAVRDLRDDDLEANTMLGTVYQRLGDIVRSDQALQRVLDRPNLSRDRHAEAYSLRGSNGKVRWREDYTRSDTDIRVAALQSPHLDEARTDYTCGFQSDCNHYYSGLNALALVSAQLELAESMPAVWSERFESEEEAEAEMRRRKAERTTLAAAVEWSLSAARTRADRLDQPDIWIDIALADLRLLTSTRAQAVAGKYREALADASPFDVDAVARQLRFFQQLGLFAANVAAALGVVDKLPSETRPVPARVLTFTGHRIDTPGRATPRFPADKEDIAREEIRRVVENERRLTNGNIVGIAGAASGGDLIFHEVCHELGVPTSVFLAVPPRAYEVASVQDGGPHWVERFRALMDRVAPRILQDSSKLPGWMHGKPRYTVWQRNNLWTLHNALAEAGGRNVTLVALWDGQKEGDGAGGTADMVATARGRGAKFVAINTKQIFEL